MFMPLTSSGKLMALPVCVPDFPVWRQTTQQLLLSCIRDAFQAPFTDFVQPTLTGKYYSSQKKDIVLENCEKLCQQMCSSIKTMSKFTFIYTRLYAYHPVPFSHPIFNIFLIIRINVNASYLPV